jgi:sensor histidine kinase YesM
MKTIWFQAQLKQDITISTQIEHESHSTHKRGSYSIFTKRSYPLAYISQSYQEHSYTSHEHHKQSHNLILAHLYGICYKCSLWYKDANMIWYINENATFICTSTLPTEAQKGKTTPCSPRKRANVAWSKGLVRISASYFSIGTWMRSIFPFSTLSLRKWYLTSMCLVLEWSKEFMATLMALVLSHMRGTGNTPHKSHSACMWSKVALSNN